eukprot:CAMPEP_0113302916 /NCGR_PEP_ID=MMETSP0010_2-20120614/3548_1 /TAXON_ID=216773 ORGANISM="Corethron hystrix, Strain 308" /NCGR_SAMPLE_ID=MMETSP0010_2 /ASSEMBLY_ACC=CAM_ASM_000155 /LENGTH=97 /DNA_ID=CAMNT_0000156823 /DNA_START=216 /DNA_END=509 /DNA_ORIENTATION=+ /assembly_acc=CAM_ASM_000155
MVGTGFSFVDESRDQFLVSLQKPLGIILEERNSGDCEIVEIIPESNAALAGLCPGDILLAVQNADVRERGLDEIMKRIQAAPRVVNLRVQRGCNLLE